MELISKEIKKRFCQVLPTYDFEKNPETKEERLERLRKKEEVYCELYNNEIGDMNEKDGYNCDLCKNKGGYMKIKEYEDGEVNPVYVHCRCMKMRSMINKLKRSGLAKSVQEYSFDKYETLEDWQKTLKAKAIEFTKDEDNTWFYIGGQSGCGKTHLCTAITVHYLRQNKSAKYMLWRDEITKIKSVINKDEEYGKLINELKTTEVLYIDDLFKMGKDSNGIVQRPTVSDINIAFEVLNYRYNNKDLITIISSEREASEIMDIDEAIGGRIYELCSKGGYLFNLKKDDKKNYRKKGVIEL